MRRAAILLLLMLLPVAGAAETLYVQSSRAQLREKPGLDAAVAAELKRGASLEVLEARDRWYRVRLDGSEGWVFRYLVADHPPLKRETVLGGEGPSIREKARRRASSATTAGAARGLGTDDRRRASARNQADYSGLERLESLEIPEEAVSDFVAEGES